MATGFGAVSFGVLLEGNPGGGASTDVNIVHIPNSNVNYVDYGGHLPTTLDVSLYSATEADFTSLLALVGTTATLTYPSGTTYANTLLVSLKRTWRSNAGHWKADASFIVP